MTYTFFKINLDGSLSDKALLNDADELNAHMAAVYGKFATVLVVQDQTRKAVTYTDTGAAWEAVKREVMA